MHIPTIKEQIRAAIEDIRKGLDLERFLDEEVAKENE